MNIVIIIPTYNEKDDIENLIDAVVQECGFIKHHTLSILLVDGNSPDGTACRIKNKMAVYNNIHLIVEPQKRGLGMAYIAGITYAIRKLGADAFIEFDGDFQHDPKDIRRLIDELDRGYDYVIGSRYVPGGKIPKKWTLYRKLLSRFGSLTTKFILRLPTHDNTSGLKLSRVKNFAEHLPLNQNEILSRRHAYKIHLLYEMFKMGAKIKEIPIIFHEREKGNSKSTVEDTFETLKVIFILRLRELKRLIF